MTVNGYRTQLRIPDSRNPSGYYYWLNAFWWNDSLQPNPLLAKIRMRGFWQQVHLDVVQMYYQQTMEPASSGVWTKSPILGTNFGEVPIEGGYSPFQAVYLRHLIGGQQVGYSRLRMPVQASDLEGVLIHQDVVDLIEFWANDLLPEAGVCDRAGTAIDEFRVNPVVMEWQYRDGGKRRQRQYITHP